MRDDLDRYEYMQRSDGWRSPRSWNRTDARRRLRWRDLKFRWRPRVVGDMGHGDLWLVEPVEVVIRGVSSVHIGCPGGPASRSCRPTVPTIHVDCDGRIEDEESLRLVQTHALDYLSVLWCRALPEAPPVAPGPSENKRLWNKYLSASMLDMTRGKSGQGPGWESGLSSPEELGLLRPSHWRRAVQRRVAVIFGRGLNNRLVRHCALILSGDRWWRWRDNHRLRELQDAATETPRTGRLMSILEGFVRVRLQLRPPFPDREPMRTKLGADIQFSWPRWPSKGAKSVFTSQREQALAAVYLAIRHWRNGAVDSRYLAAAVWMAQKYLTSPSKLTGGHVTLEIAGRYCGVTRNQVEHAVGKLRAEVATFLDSSMTSTSPTLR